MFDLCECLEIVELITFNEGGYSRFLYKAFVINYGKSFADGKERGISLSAKKVFKNNKDLLVRHNQIINARNKYVAHSDSSTYEVSEVRLASFGNHHELFAPMSKYSHPTGNSLVREKKLVIHVYKHVKEQVIRVEKAILQQQGLQIS